MSRVGKLPVPVPQGVEVSVTPTLITLKGKSGTLMRPLTSDVAVEVTDGKIWVKPANDTRHARAMWGTMRSTIAGMAKGVSEGFTIRMEILGVGYRASLNGPILTLTLGYSHEIKYAIPAGVAIKSEKPTSLEISGADRQLVGQVASEIRSFRPPEPYKGKGVRYENERVIIKEGKKK
jgi:large subunit ribosomal protein L6